MRASSRGAGYLMPSKVQRTSRQGMFERGPHAPSFGPTTERRKLPLTSHPVAVPNHPPRCGSLAAVDLRGADVAEAEPSDVSARPVEENLVARDASTTFSAPEQPRSGGPGKIEGSIGGDLAKMMAVAPTG